MSLAPDLRSALNPAQLDAVLHTDGPLLVFAGAGSGKTRVITYRTAHIVSSGLSAPWGVMCVTFTNKAAGEMRERCRTLLGEQSARDLWISTFHAAGARLLRRYHDRVGLPRDFAIYDESDARTVMNRVYQSLQLDEKDLHPRGALAKIDRYKQDVRSPDEVLDAARGPTEELFANVYANYEHQLRACGAVDFGDLLVRVVRLLETDAETRGELQRRIRYLMVDEFQDTNAAQYRIVRALLGPEKNVCVVGDDDQMIYGWRGADVRNIGYFRRDFPDAKVILLEQNYRSTGRILAAANAIVTQLAAREPKVLFTHNAEGAGIDVVQARDEREEAGLVAQRIAASVRSGVKLGEHAVFYRVHAQSRVLEEAMRAANIPYVVVGGMRFYERAEIKDLIAYLRLLVNPADDVSFLRVVNQPARGIGKTTLDRLAQYAQSKRTPMLLLCATGDLPADLGARPKKLLGEFATLMDSMRAAAESCWDRPGDLASLVLDRSGYLAMLDASQEPDVQTRKENLDELIGSMLAYAQEDPSPTLPGYLERITLDDGSANRDEAEREGRVSLMTVHSAKGLEFDTVFVTGLEEAMFPYKGVGPGGTPDELEEERRLAYVAITRARRTLVLTHATFRQIFGTTRCNPRSRFLDEIPAAALARAPAPKPSLAASVRESDGRRVEYDDGIRPLGATGGTSYRPGMRVRHKRFGEGKVRAVEPGADVKLLVYFPQLGTEKRILADVVEPA